MGTVALGNGRLTSRRSRPMAHSAPDAEDPDLIEGPSGDQVPLVVGYPGCLGQGARCTRGYRLRPVDSSFIRSPASMSLS
jgi:hypothetical protein